MRALVVVCLLLVLIGVGHAQQTINPTTQITWPLITGSGTPTGLGFSCTSIDYGQPFQDTSVTPNVYYTCGTDGWQIRGGSFPGWSATGTGTSQVVTAPGAFDAYTLHAANPGVFTNITSTCSNSGFLNGASMAMWEAGSGATQDGTCGGTIVPVGSTAWQSDGVSGFVDNYGTAGPPTGTAAVAGYFQARGYGSGGSIWPLNIVGIVQNNVTNVLMQNEFDMDIEPGATGASVFGIAMDAFWNEAPASAIGFYVNKPNTFGAGTGSQWSAGFETNVGATPSAFVAGQLATGASQPSQSIVLESQDSGNHTLSTQLYSDALGDLVLYPPSGLIITQGLASDFQGHAFRNNNGTMIGAADLGPHGNGLYLQKSDNTGTAGNLAKFDAGGNTVDGGVAASSVVTAASPTVGHAACIKSAGPPLVIGYCSTVVDSSGACTCN
jgi:hypothetical protein